MIKEICNRILAMLLACSGVRGGGILRDPSDELRSELRWRDVELQQLTQSLDVE